MNITIKDENSRFGVRVCAIIYNKDMSKVYMQKQGNHDFYMFPGGRLEIGEDTSSAIERELYEELGINENLKLKYIAENFIKFPNMHYHELGFYFILKIDEQLLKNNLNSMDKKDGESIFEWIDVNMINNYNIMPNCMKEKVKEKNTSDNIEHIMYKE